MTTKSTFHSGLQQVREQVSASLARHHRAADSVQLIAVSKQQPIEAIRAVAEEGQQHFGESYAQEALPKIQALRELPLTWHFIGQMQSNKTRAIAEQFAWVHTVDREKVARRLSEQRPHYAPPLQICVQVKLADEPGKGGAWPAEVPALVESIRHLPRLRLRGLMCVPPPSDDPAVQLAHFNEIAALLKSLNQSFNQSGLELDTLSMGMSGDFDTAIAAGATHLRIGTAIFGQRH